MRLYSASNTEEKETYSEYKERKEKDWNERLKVIFQEVRNSSLKEKDKERFTLNIFRTALSK